MVSEWQLILWWCEIKIPPPPVGNRVKEKKLNLLGSLGNNDIKQKWKIIKSITDGDRNKEDPAREIDLER